MMPRPSPKQVSIQIFNVGVPDRVTFLMTCTTPTYK